jgi:hypothetical protein
LPATGRRRDPGLVDGLLHRRGSLFARHPAAERQEALKQSFKVQVFATDIDQPRLRQPAPDSIRPALPLT